jgi:outer membrane protein OmpA-like peptidoglycan-associated protein
MSVRMWAACGVLLCSMASGAMAQSPGAFEIGGFGRMSFFPDTLSLDDHLGYGGWLGFYPARNLAIEGEAAYTKTKVLPASFSTVSSIPLRGRLTYNIPLGDNASAFQIGAGYVRNLYRKDQHFNDNGVTGLAGLRLGLLPFLGLRLSVTMDYVPSPAASRADHYTNLGIQMGLGLLLNNRADADRDGVKDNLDRCPNTPRGEQVDTSGCSAGQRDTDSDGVKDNLDKCPNTPAGEQVDANGCSRSQLDADGDGVTDGVDKCPDTPKGEPVDASGCSASQRDADGDGVKDGVDKCPDTPKGEAVDANGCSDSQRDADGDGVKDKDDQCPNTPAGEPVDARGCSRDSDADGVPDGRDKCPNTPNGQAVDENGCPVLFEGEKKSVVLKGVNFDIGKATLTEDSKLVLKDVATSLAARPDVRVEVQGHTDISGGRPLNLRLSKARARTVEKFLEENGVSPSQLTAKGYGPDKPIASNKTKAGRAQNRRVELVRLN